MAKGEIRTSNVKFGTRGIRVKYGQGRGEIGVKRG